VVFKLNADLYTKKCYNFDWIISDIMGIVLFLFVLVSLDTASGKHTHVDLLLWLDSIYLLTCRNLFRFISIL